MTRGIRNNNPCNIRIGSSWLGLSKETEDIAFCKFTNVEYGLRATLYLLFYSYRLRNCKTLKQCIYRWAPPAENKTNLYLDRVVNYLDCSPDSLMINIDSFRLLKVMCLIESTYNLELPVFVKAVRLLPNKVVNSNHSLLKYYY